VESVGGVPYEKTPFLTDHSLKGGGFPIYRAESDIRESEKPSSPVNREATSLSFKVFSLS